MIELHRAHEGAEQSQAWLERVLHSISQAIVITDALGLIRSVYPATEALFGWKAEELNGKIIDKAMPFLSYSSENHIPFSFNPSLTPPSTGLATLVDHEHREVRVEIGTAPVLDKDNGFTLGAVTVMGQLDDV